MFIQRDPIGLLGGNNVFAYAPNPIHWVDVFGLEAAHLKTFWGKVGNKDREKYQVHHIFPQELFAGKGKNATAKTILDCHGFNQDNIHNLIGLPRYANDNPRGGEMWFGRSAHRSSHTDYTNAVRVAIEKIGSNTKLTCRQAKASLLLLQRGLRTSLQKGVPIMSKDIIHPPEWGAITRKLLRG